ncbi:MAG: hypothetical protein ACXWQO_08935 [Bdellovibrionota bacterium]
MKVSIYSLLILTCLGSPAFAGKEAGNGGDEVALDFLKSATSALEEIHRSSPDLDKLLAPSDLETVARAAQVVVTDTPLMVDLDGVTQESTAVNQPDKNLILINRARWNKISNPELKRGIALHEVASLKGLESTGNYPLSSAYVSKHGSNSNILIAATTEISAKLFDTILQVPKEIQDVGSITVVGERGSAHKDLFLAICQMALDKREEPVLNSLGSCTGHKLGEEVHLPAGAYFLYFGISNPFDTERADAANTHWAVKLGEGEKKIITLAKLEIPKIDGSYSFQVFKDFTTRREQEKYALKSWILNAPSFEAPCSGYTQGKHAVADCLAWKGKNYRTLIGTEFRFTKTGAVDELVWAADTDAYFSSASKEDGELASVQRQRVGYGHDGDFILVFPGTYIVTFTSSGGHSTERYGVEVK